MKGTGRLEQLMQLIKVTFDGDLIGKLQRDALVKAGLAQRCDLAGLH